MFIEVNLSDNVRLDTFTRNFPTQIEGNKLFISRVKTEARRKLDDGRSHSRNCRGGKCKTCKSEEKEHASKNNKRRKKAGVLREEGFT